VRRCRTRCVSAPLRRSLSDRAHATSLRERSRERGPRRRSVRRPRPRLPCRASSARVRPMRQPMPWPARGGWFGPCPERSLGRSGSGDPLPPPRGPPVSRLPPPRGARRGGGPPRPRRASAGARPSGQGIFSKGETNAPADALARSRRMVWLVLGAIAWLFGFGRLHSPSRGATSYRFSTRWRGALGRGA